MGDVISLKFSLFGSAGEAAAYAASEVGATGSAADTPAGRATGVDAAMMGWKSLPLLRVILKPSFSILNTERSFFLIRAMSSLISLSSKAMSWLRLRAFGKSARG